MTTADGALAPLRGVRVLDWSEGVAGPYAGQMLGDLGADVVKIERPEGDWGRTMGGGPPSGGAHFRALNRNKRALCLDLRQHGAGDVAAVLIDRADVVVMSFRPGVAERLGVGYEQVAARSPSVVYARVSAYGPEGPLSHVPGSDTVLQAISGLMAQIGEPDEEPHRIGVPIIDFAAARDLVIGVLTALLARGRGTPLPGPIDVSLFASAATLQSQVWQKYLESGTVQVRAGRRHPSLAPAGLYRTADARQVAVAVLRDEHFVKLCDAVGLPELPRDPRFATNGARLAHRDELEAFFVPRFEARDLAEWTEVLLRHDVLAAPVTDVADIAADSALYAAVPIVPIPGGALGEPADGTAPAGTSVGFPVSFGGAAPAHVRWAPPALGEHTRQVLEEAGLTGSEIDTLIERRVVQQWRDEAVPRGPGSPKPGSSGPGPEGHR